MPHNVVVVSTGHGCMVVPGHQVVERGDVVHITNHTKAPIDLSFPDPDLWLKEPKKSLVDKETDTGTVAANAPGGFYPYSVYCHRDGDYAEGHSHPGFIVR